MRTSSLTALFLTGVILAAAGNAAAAGLGKLTVLSSLGDRLTADVELVSVTPAEVSSLKARVAPPQAYAHSNVPYSMALSDLHVKVEKHANGRPYLRITSAHPYNEPYLDVLLQLNWDGGEITREYTALVNPAGYHMPPAVAAGAPRSSARAATAPAPQTRSVPRVHRAPAPAPTHAPDSYQVKHGDTLYGIAGATMPNEVTVDQMLIGLYRANPQAFHGNINRMTAGKILRIPSTDQIEQVSPSRARHEVRLQIKNWHAYRNRIAAAASSKSAAAPEAGGTVSGKISTKVEEAHPAGAAAPKDVVKLSKGEAPGAAAGKGESATARLQALEEEAGARQKQLDEANSRIAQLEKTITDMRKLIQIKSAGMASAQQQAQQVATAPGAPAAGAATNAPTAAPAGSNSSASTPASAAASTPTGAAAGAMAAAGSATEPGVAAATPGSAVAASKSTTGSNSTAESNSTTASNSTVASNSTATSQPAAPAGSTAGPAAATTAATTAAASKPATTAAAAKEPVHGAAASGATQPGQSAEQPVAETKPVAKAEATAAHVAPKHVIPKPAPQTGFLQMLTENPLYVGAAVIIILLLIYLWIRRRRDTADDGESEFPAAPVLAGGAAAATTAAAFASVKDSPPPAASPVAAPAPEPQPAAQAGVISDEVDPLAEAEVYIAYGRDEQAEEILKDALVQHPERVDIQVKLLEVYAARKDTAAFETLAQKLHQSVGSGSEEWLKVAALGYTLDPANSLFEAGKVAPSPVPAASAPDGLDFELDMPAAQTATDIQLDPAPDDESVSKTGRLSAQFAAAGLELTAPHGAIAPDFVLPGGTPGPEDTQRIAEDDNNAADEPAPIPDFTLARGSNAPAVLDFGDADEPGTARTDGESGKTLNLEDSQLLMDEALRVARAEPLMPDFRLDLPAQPGSTTGNAGPDGSDHAKAPDLTLDSAKSGDQPMDLALEPDATVPAAGKGTVPTFDLSGINLEFDEQQPSVAVPASGEKDGHWHDVQTKFDLAKAYQEMGDRDGAREILREVVEEGDGEQQTQAKVLLRNLD